VDARAPAGNEEGRQQEVDRLVHPGLYRTGIWVGRWSRHELSAERPQGVELMRREEASTPSPARRLCLIEQPSDEIRGEQGQGAERAARFDEGPSSDLAPWFGHNTSCGRLRRPYVLLSELKLLIIHLTGALTPVVTARHATGQ